MLNRIHMFKKFKYRISCQDKIRKTKLCYNRKIFIGLLLFHFASFSSVPKKEEEEEEGRKKIFVRCPIRGGGWNRIIMPRSDRVSKLA